MAFVRQGCYRNIKKYEPFDFSGDGDIDFTIRMAILVVKQYYNDDINSDNIKFVTNQFDEFFNNGHDINKLTNEGTYLHYVCEKTMWGHPFCIELFDYFISKGIDPLIKNSNGLTCLDLISDENKSKACIR